MVEEAVLEARREVEASDRRLMAWEGRRAAAGGARRFALTIRPLLGGPGSAITLPSVTQDTKVRELKAMVQRAHPRHPAPDTQQLVVGNRTRLDDDDLPIGAYELGPELSMLKNAGQLKLSVLKKRAAEAGVDPQALIDADDVQDVRAKVLALLLDRLEVSVSLGVQDAAAAATRREARAAVRVDAVAAVGGCRCPDCRCYGIASCARKLGRGLGGYLLLCVVGLWPIVVISADTCDTCDSCLCVDTCEDTCIAIHIVAIHIFGALLCASTICLIPADTRNSGGFWCQLFGATAVYLFTGSGLFCVISWMEARNFPERSAWADPVVEDFVGFTGVFLWGAQLCSALCLVVRHQDRFRTPVVFGLCLLASLLFGAGCLGLLEMAGAEDAAEYLATWGWLFLIVTVVFGTAPAYVCTAEPAGCGSVQLQAGSRERQQKSTGKGACLGLLCLLLLVGVLAFVRLVFYESETWVVLLLLLLLGLVVLVVCAPDDGAGGGGGGGDGLAFAAVALALYAGR